LFFIVFLFVIVVPKFNLQEVPSLLRLCKSRCTRLWRNCRKCAWVSWFWFGVTKETIGVNPQMVSGIRPMHWWLVLCIGFCSLDDG